MVRTFVRYDSLSFPGGAPHGRRLVNPYAVVWGAYPNLNLTFVAPLVSVHAPDPGGPAGRQTTTSFADGFIFGRYDLVRVNVPQGFTRLAPEVGVKLPSGGTFSSGSTDPVGTLVFSHWRDPHAFIADLQFVYTTKGKDDLRLGNHWNYDLAYLYRLLPREGLGVPFMLLVLEINGEHARRARQRVAPLVDTGGNLLFFSPGIQFQPSRQLMLEIAAPVPVVRDLNGRQAQPRWGLLGGIRWLF